MRRLTLLPIFLAVLTVACGSDSAPTAPSPVTGTPLAAPVLAAMQAAIADEYRAETIYTGVITDFGALAPFTNVLTAEQRHSAALAGLYVRRGLVAPTNPWTLDTVPRFATCRAACATGVVAEQENIAIYDRYLTLDPPRMSGRCSRATAPRRASTTCRRSSDAPDERSGVSGRVALYAAMSRAHCAVSVYCWNCTILPPSNR